MATITEPTKIKLEFKEAVYMYGGDYNQGYEDGKSDGIDEGKKIGYDEGVEFGKANAPREERSVTYKANGSYEVLPTSSNLLMEKVNVVVDIPDDGSYSEGYTVGYSDGEAYGKANAPTEDLNITLTSNGTYSYPKPSDKYHADVSVTVNVPSEKTPTQEKSVTITKNGTDVVVPDEGFALDKVTVTTNIDTRLPEQTKEVTITENGTTNVLPDSGYTLAGVSVTTDIDTRLPEQEKTLEVTENKTYEVTPDTGYALSKVTVTGNVAGSGGDSGEQVWTIATASPDSADTSTLKNSIISMRLNYPISLSGYSYYFEAMSKLINLDIALLDTSNATNFTSMFSGCYSLQSLDLSSFDTSKVTSIKNMFRYCSALTSLDLSNFNTSQVTSLENMFQGVALTSLDLSSFDTSKVTSLYGVVADCQKLASINLSSFDTSKVTNMDQLFYYCSALTSLDLSNFDTSKVTSLDYAFYYCNTLENVIFGDNWASNSRITSFEMVQSPLSKASILDLASKIADKSDTSVYTGTYTVKLKSSQKSLFTEEELTALAGQFTAKNWTLAWS